MKPPTLIVQGKATKDAKVAASGAIFFDIHWDSGGIPVYFKVFVNSKNQETREAAMQVKSGDIITVTGAYMMVIVEWKENGVTYTGPQPRLVVYRDQPDERNLVDGVEFCRTTEK